MVQVSYYRAVMTVMNIFVVEMWILAAVMDYIDMIYHPHQGYVDRKKDFISKWARRSIHTNVVNSLYQNH